MVERLGHKVAEKWQRSQQSGQADALLRGTMLRWRKTFQTTVRLSVSRVELLKDTGEQHMLRVDAGERHLDYMYGNAHQSTNLELMQTDVMQLPLRHGTP